MIEKKNIIKSSKYWQKKTPYPHFVIDNFFEPKIAKLIEKEFPNFDDSCWHEYGNALEIKKVLNNWNNFPPAIYRIFNFLNSSDFVNFLSKKLFNNKTILFSDSGLNGGGLHIHKTGGKLNTHLDYSIHPKLGLQRKLNIIIYLNSKWKKEWGGNLGLWGNESSKKPGKLMKEIEPKFNRAILFDTTCNSWHGLPEPLMCPKNQYRKSLAVYYLCEPKKNTSLRGKALFAPSQKQIGNKEVLKLIKLRSKIKTASSVYK